MKRTIFMILGSFALVSIVHAASFDCSKATTKVEKTICTNDALSQADSDLNITFIKVRDSYDSGKRKNLIKGQRNWLKLRGIACIIEGVSDENKMDIQPCLLSVYKERKSELDELAEIKEAYKGKDRKQAADIEKILDEKHDWQLGSMFAMKPNGSFQEEVEFIPSTCRELFTANAGAWKFQNDGVHIPSALYVFNTCAYNIYSAQNYSSKPVTDPAVNFNDFMQYSIEFRCFASYCEHDEEDVSDMNLSSSEPIKAPAAKKKKKLFPFKNKNAITFRQAASLGMIKISHDKEDDGTLTISGKNSYTFNGMHYSYILSPIGDYTNKGRKEALMSLSYDASPGSMHGSMLLVVYYDPETKSIRPEMISQKSRLRLSTDGD